MKFLAIFVNNLDEFFMIRVAGVHDQVEARIDARGPDGLAPVEALEGIAGRVAAQDRRHSRQFRDVIRPALAENGIRIVSCQDADPEPGSVERHFREQIFPVLTPLAIGPGRPFPYISNLSLSLIVRLHDPETDNDAYARVKVPKEVLPRFVEISKNTFVPLEDIIASHLDLLFPGMEIIGHSAFPDGRNEHDRVASVHNTVERQPAIDVIGGVALRLDRETVRRQRPQEDVR